MPSFAPYKDEELRVIARFDPAVDEACYRAPVDDKGQPMKDDDGNPMPSPWDRYVETLDESHLGELLAEPRRYVLRVLSTRERDILLRDWMEGANSASVAYDVVSVCLVAIEGPGAFEEPKVTALRLRTGGLMRIPDRSGLWSDEKRFPPGAVVSIASALHRQMHMQVREGN